MFYATGTRWTEVPKILLGMLCVFVLLFVFDYVISPRFSSATAAFVRYLFK